MRLRTSLNEGWTFAAGTSADWIAHPLTGEAVSLPHNAVDLPYDYFDETSFHRAFTYQTTIAWRPEFEGREVRLVFDGAMADAKVYLNGTAVVAHKDGYTPFVARLTDHLRPGDNLVTITIDGSENPTIPPFGGRVDYLTYAGIYRDVWLEVAAPVSIANVKIETADELTDAKQVAVICRVDDPRGLGVEGELVARLLDGSGREIATTKAAASSAPIRLHFADLAGLSLWDIDSPTLYNVEVSLATAHGGDRQTASFGFRTAKFTTAGFELNGKPLKIRGLNRHQSFPYVGYAMGRSAQESDAEILKHRLKCNLVRTSHYPQSPWFLDHCDRIGLLVFEEIPGWQHIGDRAWQAESVRNVEAMITRDWNHPSIVLWGVRINESPDNHDFYVETNRVAHELDPTRQTGGVRCITDSEFLEDVYTMNDFNLGSEELPGSNRPRLALRDQQDVTGLPQRVPYLVTEFNGHMYPTKRYDQEQRQAEHVTRHLEVLNAAYGDPNVIGAIGWCMFDYNTHRDFGSGDRICHHGVLDMFREPKFAAYAYASQCEPTDEVIFKPVTVWARGERNIGGVLPLIVLTNCDEVALRYGGMEKRAAPDRENYPHLPHPPVVFDHRHFSRQELGNWGMNWLDGTLVGYIDGKQVAEIQMVAGALPTTLQVAPDRTTLSGKRDSVRVIVRALDQAGNLLPFLNDSIQIKIAGPGRLIGPSLVPLRGGTAGFWLESTGDGGTIHVSVACDRLPSTTIELSASTGGSPS